jgi:antitoxin component YwqK of YwqJK toxin-antitoxin module
MIFPIILLISGLCFTLKAQSVDTLNRTDQNGKKQGYWKKYEKDTLKYEGFFKDDTPVGEFKYYYGNGKLKALMYYLDNDFRRSEMYHPNGLKMAQGNYRGNLKDSIWLYYNETGTLVSEEFYRNGMRSGVWKTFYPNGTVSEEISYDNDLRQGSWQQFYSEGEKKLEGNYSADKKDGPIIMFYPNKQLLLSGQYLNDDREGEWSYYIENGSLQKKRIYKGGFLTSEVIYIETEE